MFKAINRQSGEVIILADCWADRIDYLRSLDAEDILVCQGCRQPVRVRAGVIKRRHFAHKHLANCPFGRESPELLAARAALYKRLAQEFGESVTLEKRFEDALFPREVDCWVERGDGNLAYWIVDRAMRPDAREKLAAGFRQVGATAHRVFTAALLRPGAGTPDLVHLTTTEREFQRETGFDLEKEGGLFVTGSSLHYLDGENETLTTFRNLSLMHAPQAYRGRRECSELADVLISRKTGEFAHPGERERVSSLRQEKARLENLERERKERLRLEREQQEKLRLERLEREQQERLRLAELERQRQEELRQARLEAERQERERQAQQERERQGQLRGEREEGRPQEGARLDEQCDDAHRSPWLPAAHPPGRASSPRRPSGQSAPRQGPPETPLTFATREATCVFCGRKTTDWWSLDGATGECKCRDCLREGRC